MSRSKEPNKSDASARLIFDREIASAELIFEREIAKLERLCAAESAKAAKRKVRSEVLFNVAGLTCLALEFP